MIENTLLHEIARRFDMPGLNHLIHKSIDNQSEYQANLIWVMSTHYFTRLTRPPMTLAVVHSDKWSKGLILFPPFEESFKKPLKAVEFEKDKDVVQTYLSTLDLTYSHNIAKLGNHRSRDFYLYTSTNRSYANLSFKDPYDSQTQIRELWDAFFQMIDLLADIYDIDLLYSYVKHR